MRRILILAMFVFIASLISASCNQTQIDINSANAKELDRIIWVGNATAQLIIDYRTNNRTFASVDDLINIKRITASRLADIKTQNLACVSSAENQIPQNASTEIKANVSIKIDIPVNETQNYASKITPDTIVLENSKDIKSEKSFGNYNTYAVGALMVFSAVIALLLALKKKNPKNEL